MTEEKPKLQAQAEVEELGPGKSRLTVKVPADTVKLELDKSFGELANTVVTKGFRPGHVPMVLVQKRFGEQVTNQVKQDLIDRSLQEVLDQKDLHPLGTAQVEKVEFEPDKDLTFEATILLKPSFEVKNYLGIELSQPPTAVTREELDAQIEGIRHKQAHLEPVAEGAQVEENHVLLADCVIKVDDQEAWKLDNAELPVGSRNWLLSLSKDINTKLVGLKVGEEAVVEAELGQNFPVEKFRNQKGVLTVHVREIKQIVLPEINEELAKRLGLASLNELKERLTAGLSIEKQQRVRALLERKLVDKLLGMVEFELPEDIVQAQAEHNLKRYKLQLQTAGTPEAKIDEQATKLAEASKEKALRDFKTYFILEKIAEQEKVLPTEAELRARVATMAANYNITVQRMMDNLRSRGLLPELRVQIREAKTIQHLLDKAKIVQELELPDKPSPGKQAGGAMPARPEEKEQAEETSGPNNVE